MESTLGGLAAMTAHTSASSPRAHFQTIPPRIRNEIFVLVLEEGEVQLEEDWPALLRICKQFEAEALPMYLARNLFSHRQDHLSDPALERFLQKVSQARTLWPALTPDLELKCCHHDVCVIAAPLTRHHKWDDIIKFLSRYQHTVKRVDDLDSYELRADEVYVIGVTRVSGSHSHGTKTVEARLKGHLQLPDAETAHQFTTVRESIQIPAPNEAETWAVVSWDWVHATAPSETYLNLYWSCYLNSWEVEA